MIVFKHGATNFENLLLRLDIIGNPSQTALYSAFSVWQAASKAISLSKPRRLTFGDGEFLIRCEYNQHTADIAMTSICGFEWLAAQMPDEVKVERISSKRV